MKVLELIKILQEIENKNLIVYTEGIEGDYIVKSVELISGGLHQEDYVYLRAPF